MAGHDDQYVLYRVETGIQIQLGIQIVGKRCAGQVALIGAIAGNFLQVVGVDIPESDDATTTSQL